LAKLYERAKLLHGLLGGDLARTGPAYVDIDLTSRCNLRCVGCPYHPPRVSGSQLGRAKADLSVGLFKGLCGELKAMGTHSLVLQGAGEPLLHPRAADIIATAKECGLHVTMLTNGTLLDEEMIRGLIEAGLDVVRVSLWATSAEEYQRNHPGSDPANFGRVVGGLGLLARLKGEQRSASPRVVAYCVINRHTFRSIDAAIHLASEAGCDGLDFAPMHNAWGVAAQFGLSADEAQEVRHSLEGAKRRLESLSLAHNLAAVLRRYRIGQPVWEKTPCYVPWFHARVRAEGTVQPCGRCNEELNLGDLREQSFREIWNGPAMRAFRREALAQSGPGALEDCDCALCCYVGDNLRVHRVFRWLRPFAAATRSSQRQNAHAR
jgi:radical SAM protein with 4Fe4S-binding SPASM domain